MSGRRGIARTLALAAPAACIVAAAGCGSDDPGRPAAGPASLAPAAATVYAETVLRPEGEQREALKSALSLLLDTADPGGFLVDELDRALAESDAGVSYEVDVEPWLGERGALFFTDLFPQGSGPALGEDGERGAILIEATDSDEASAFVEAVAAEQGDTEAGSYEGVDYRVDEDGVAAGVVRDHLVFGDEPTFQEVVDTEAGAEALADEDRFASAAGEDTGAVATLYVDVPEIVSAADAAGELEGSDRELLDSLLADFSKTPLTASVEATENSLALEVVHGTAEIPFLSAADESSLLPELPDDAWLAVGFNDLGGAVASLFESGDQLGIGAAELGQAQRQFQSEYGLRLSDFYGPLGDGALFALGRGIFGSGGGLVLEADSETAARKVLGALREGLVRSGEAVRDLGRDADAEGFAVTIPDAPSALNFVASGERLVVAYGDEAAAAALDPGETLGSAPEFEAASAELGEEFAVGFFLDFAPLVELLDFAAVAEPSVQEAMRYLRAIDFVVAGSVEEGGVVRQRLLLGLVAAVSGPAT